MIVRDARGVGSVRVLDGRSTGHRTLRPEYKCFLDMEPKQVRALHTELAIIDCEIFQDEPHYGMVCSQGRNPRELMKRGLTDRVRKKFDELTGCFQFPLFQPWR